MHVSSLLPPLLVVVAATACGGAPSAPPWQTGGMTLLLGCALLPNVSDSVVIRTAVSLLFPVLLVTFFHACELLATGGKTGFLGHFQRCAPRDLVVSFDVPLVLWKGNNTITRI